MKNRFNALRLLVRKDLVTYFSNRRALLISLAAPIAIAAFFGSLFGGGKDSERSRIPIAIVDLDGSPISKRIVASMSADDAFEVRPLDAAAAIAEVRRGKLRAVVTLPAGFGASAPRSLFSPAGKPVIDIQYDPSQAIELQVVEGLLTSHVMDGVMGSAFSVDSTSGGTHDLRADVENDDRLAPGPKQDLRALFDAVDRVRDDTARADGGATPGAPPGATTAAPGALRQGGGFQLPYTTHETAAKTNSNSNYNAYSHSFAGMGVQFILFMGIDLGIKLLQARRMGLWQRLRAAPLSRGFLLGSQVASGALIAALLFAGIFAAGIAFFNVRVEGSVAGFVGLIVAFACLTASFGLFIAALGRTPEATRGLAIFATLLMVMLGGAWVPAFVFPRWLQTASLAMPTRWAIDGFDAVTWRGLGFEAAWLPIVVTFCFALLFAVVAVWRFEWDEK